MAARAAGRGGITMRAMLPAGLLLLSWSGWAVAEAPGTEPPPQPAVAVYRGSESNVASTVRVYRGSSDMGSPPAPQAAQPASVAPEVVVPGYTDPGTPGLEPFFGRRLTSGFPPNFQGRFDTFPAPAGTVGVVHLDNGPLGVVSFGSQPPVGTLPPPAFVGGPQTFSGDGLGHALRHGGVVVAGRPLVPGHGYGGGGPRGPG